MEIEFHYGGGSIPDLPVVPKQGDKLIVTYADGSETTYTFGVPVVTADGPVTQRLFLTAGQPQFDYEVIE